MAPASQQGDIRALAASMEAMRALLEESRDEAREDRKDTSTALAKLGERQAVTEERLLAVSKAQESTAASVLNGYREHSKEALAARDAAETVRLKFEEFRTEVQARFSQVEQGVSAVVPAVADAANEAALPQRNKIAKGVQRSLWGVGALTAFAFIKWFVPDAHSLPGYWHFFVHLVNGTDKIVSQPLG